MRTVEIIRVRLFMIFIFIYYITYSEMEHCLKWTEKKKRMVLKGNLE
jgi:hypothetical protein